MVNLEATTQKMLEATRVLDFPAFQYIDPMKIKEALGEEYQKAADREICLR